MNRRNFLKNIGKGAAGAAVIATVGSEVVEALSATPAYEVDGYTYFWYNHKQYEARSKWEDRMEMSLFEHWGNKSLSEFAVATSPMIMKDKYEITGGDISEVKWIRVKKE